MSDRHSIVVNLFLSSNISSRQKIFGIFVYFAYTIPANIYKDQTEEIQSVALPTVLCVDANRISDELAYESTKNLYENVEEVNELYAGFDLDPQKTIDALKIPLHDGAKKYYEEIGY